MKKAMLLSLALFTAGTIMSAEWSLVTDVSELQAGDEIILACTSEGYTAGEMDASKGYLKAVESQFTSTKDGISSLGEGTVVLTLGGGQNGWTLSLDGQTIGTAAARKLQSGKGTDTWTITIVDGDAVITSTNESYGAIQFNKNAPRFLNYTSNQTAVQLFRSGSSAAQVRVSYEGFPYKRTRCEEPLFASGTTITLSSAVPEKEGKKLTGWRYEGKLYEPGAGFVVPETDAVLVPVWEGGTGVEAVQREEAPCTKIIREGQLLILRDGVLYNAQGARVQ